MSAILTESIVVVEGADYRQGTGCQDGLELLLIFTG
jgi:hypothetical protein